MHRLTSILLASLLQIPVLATSQTLQGEVLVEALQGGGLVLVMRHARAPEQLPDANTVNPDNTTGERQLDVRGRRDAVALGDALRRLGIPVSELRSSPTYRTLETARLLGMSEAIPTDYLGGQGMQVVDGVRASGLRAAVRETPDRGNVLLVSHSNILAAAFPETEHPVAQGEVLVFKPADGGTTLIARLLIRDWANL